MIDLEAGGVGLMFGVSVLTLGVGAGVFETDVALTTAVASVGACSGGLFFMRCAWLQLQSGAAGRAEDRVGEMVDAEDV